MRTPNLRFGTVTGKGGLVGLLRAGVSPDSIIASWTDDVAAFHEQRSSALLY